MSESDRGETQIPNPSTSNETLSGQGLLEPNIEALNLTPEQLAQNLAVSYYSGRLKDLQETCGGELQKDHPQYLTQSMYEAGVRNSSEGNFFNGFELPYEPDGGETKINHCPSIYEQLKEGYKQIIDEPTFGGDEAEFTKWESASESEIEGHWGVGNAEFILSTIAMKKALEAIEKIKPIDRADDAMDTGTGLDMTIGAQNGWQRPNPNRFFKEESQTDGLDEVNNQTPTSEAQSADLISDAPVSDLPEMTAEERIEKGKELAEYQNDLLYDIANPEDVKYTPEQEKNNEITEGLLKKYPHAFIQRSTDDGRSYLILDMMQNGNYYDCIERSALKAGSQRKYDEDTLMFSYRGLTFLSQNVKDYDLTPLLDLDKYDTKRSFYNLKKIDGSGEKDFNAAYYVFYFEHYNYDSSDLILGSLKSMLQIIEKNNEEEVRKKKEQVKSAKEILDIL